MANHRIPRARFADVNAAKADFGSIYTMDDPREYYRVLHGLDYIIPDLAKSTFRAAVAALEAERGRPITVLDIGSSYGINAALLRYPLDIDRLAQRYRDLADAALDTAALIDLDRHYFAAWPRRPLTVVGLDASAPAMAYAHAVGLLDVGLACDLERDVLTDEARRALANVDLVISTGCVGYVGERTFAAVLDAIEGPRPWVVSFVLRMFPFDGIAGLLARHGLVTEKLEGVTFVQRRFHTAAELQHTLETLAARGIATEGKEDQGLYHAELHVSRPATDVAGWPLDSLAAVTSGASRTFGRRYVRGTDDAIRFGR